MGRIKIGNIKGPQGEAGKDFEYAKTYASVSAMNADYSGTDVEVGEYVIIDSGNNDADNGKVYRKGSNAYTYEHNIAGPTGPRGATGPMPTLYNGLDVTTPGLGALDAAVGPTIANKVSASGGEAGDTVASFTSADSTTDSDITAFTAMEKLTSGSALKTLMNVVSKAVRNVRWLKKKADAADTSISSLNDAIAAKAQVRYLNPSYNLGSIPAQSGSNIRINFGYTLNSADYVPIVWETSGGASITAIRYAILARDKTGLNIYLWNSSSSAVSVTYGIAVVS